MPTAMPSEFGARRSNEVAFVPLCPDTSRGSTRTAMCQEHSKRYANLVLDRYFPVNASETLCRLMHQVLQSMQTAMRIEF